MINGKRPLEWSTHNEERKRHKIARLFFLFAALGMFGFFLVAAWLFPFIMMQVFFVVFVVLWLFKTKDYEFIYAGDEMNAAVIYNRRRRRKKFTFLTADIQCMVKKIDRQGQVKYYCDKKDEGELYTLVVRRKGKIVSLVMNADPKFVEIMRSQGHFRG